MPLACQCVKKATRRGDHWSSADFATQNLSPQGENRAISLQIIRKTLFFGGRAMLAPTFILKKRVLWQSNMPLACFLNGLTRPVREIKNRTAPKGLSQLIRCLTHVHTHPGASAGQGTLPRPKKVSTGHFLTPAAPGAAFRVPSEKSKTGQPPKGLSCFWCR